MKNESSIEAELIRRQVQVALAANRTPEYHYPGYLLGCYWPRIGEADLDAVMPDGPLGRNVDGTANLAGLGVLLDVALATAARLNVERGARQATVHLHAKFTSKRFHNGRSFAAVRTEIRNADQTRVLEVSHHAA